MFTLNTSNMKTQYNKISIIFGLSVAGLMAGCSSTLSYNDALQKNIKRIQDSEKLDDARFLVDAANFNILATRLAEAAVESGYSASVVNMAKQNLGQHKAMQKELNKLARKEKIVLPAEMNEEHARLLADLTGSDRREFDRTYIRILREINQEDSQKFSRMATEAESDEIRAFAARKLGMFEGYETELQTVDADLLRTY